MLVADVIFGFTIVSVASFGLGNEVGKQGGVLKNIDISEGSRIKTEKFIKGFLNKLFGNESKDENKVISITDHNAEILAQKKRSSSN